MGAPDAWNIEPAIWLAGDDLANIQIGKAKQARMPTLAVVIPLFILLLAAISLGWLGQVDGEKVSDFPIFQNAQ